MKVLLINPPQENMLQTELPTEVEEERGIYPSLGIMYVAAYAERYTDHTVEILDANAEGIDHKSLKQAIENRKPDIVGIQSITYTFIDAIETARTVKSISQDIPVVMGGIHATIYPDATIRFPEVDYVIAGEGEISFTQLLNSLNDKARLSEVPGLLYKDKGTVCRGMPSKIVENLDSLPFPARHLTPYKTYYSPLASRAPLTTMISSKGCPNQCTFCDRPLLSNRFRARSPKNIVDEMEAATKLGIYEFSLYDDTFTTSRKRAIEVCEEILRRGMKIGWDIRARVNTVDQELLNLLKKAGCERIYFGVESGDPDILKKIKKNIKLEDVRKAFRMTTDAGIKALGYFMIGLPTETREQINRTIDFALSLPASYCVFEIFIPFPATEIYHEGLSRGIFKTDYWAEFAANPTREFKVRYCEDILKKEELQELCAKAYKQFYFRPSYLVRRLLAIKSWHEFSVQLKGGLKLLKV
ncbi:radical SAM protein [candidate division WS5 bacterium]|uniref:Radical SAM protein n=1 Tax=candidate division WS5 bacterium TaxID=2093353 RepID=A0A419DC05_9BACT|nr:MAG: radical SAM protein [candidate division WS5 bacterium]